MGNCTYRLPAEEGEIFPDDLAFGVGGRIRFRNTMATVEACNVVEEGHAIEVILRVDDESEIPFVKIEDLNLSWNGVKVSAAPAKPKRRGRVRI